MAMSMEIRIEQKMTRNVAVDWYPFALLCLVSISRFSHRAALTSTGAARLSPFSLTPGVFTYEA